MMKVPELLSLAAKKRPDHIAVYDEEGEISYSQLYNEVQITAQRLHQAGIKAGTCVGVMGQNSRHFIIMVFAVMECGAVVMPVSNQVSQHELENSINVAGLSALLDDQSNERYMQANRIDFVCEEKKWKLFFTPHNEIDSPFAPHVAFPALIRFTSGTTGTSKGVILSHQTILERTEAANKILKLNQNDKVVWVLSMAYHFVVSIILYLRYGSAIIICNEFMADAIIEKTNKYGGTFLYASPMHFRLLSGDTTSRMMPTLTKVISTSIAISKEQCEKFKARFNITVSQAYGIIEIGLPIINFEKSDEYPDAVGYALPDYSVEILDDAGTILPFGKIGHLAIKGPGMLDGYLNPPAPRDQILKKGWFFTGDLASKTPDGLIHIEGRIKSMINVSGNKVFPEEVETVLNTHPGIEESKVSGYTHPLLGECVKAEVVLRRNAAPPDTETLRQFCRQHLSSYKIPQQFIFVEVLPKTDSGKLKRG